MALRLAARFRSLVIVTVLLFVSRMQWGIYARNPFIPSELFQHIILYVVEHYVQRLGDRCRYATFPSIFIENNELKHMAVPPEHGGPPNQMALIIASLGLMLNIILGIMPFGVIQFIGCFINLVTTFQFMITQMNMEGIKFTNIKLGVYLNILCGVATIFVILSTPNRPQKTKRE